MAAAVAVPAEAARPARPIAASTPSASWQRAARVPALGLPGDLGEEAGGAGWGQGVPIQNSSQGGELGLLSVREIAAAVVRNAGLWVPEIVSPAPEPGSCSLVEAFTRNAPQEQRAKFIEILGLMLHNTDTPAPAVLGRLQQLWEWRFNQLRTTPDADTGELAGFGWWFGSGKLGPDWALAHLQELRNR